VVALKKSNLAVCYLFRGVDAGFECAHRFISHYGSNKIILEHTVYILAKGFAQSTDLEHLKSECLSLGFLWVELPDDCFDLGAYYRAAQIINADYFCFLNSYSYPNCDFWLDLLFKALNQPNVGLVGATAAWNSTVIPIDWFNWRYLLSNLRRLVITLKQNLTYLRENPPFPNYFIRTTGFLIRRGDFLSYMHSCGLPYSKAATYKIEHGWNSLSKFFINKNLNVLVVNANGNTYNKEEWDQSDTFWMDEQARLLISDNQTDLFLQLKTDAPDLAAAIEKKCWRANQKPRLL
jgi:hypothetical protein